MKTNINLLLMLIMASSFVLSPVVSAHNKMSNIRSESDNIVTLNVTATKDSLKDESFLYYDVKHIADSINECGRKMPYFLDWMFKTVKGLNGTYGLLETHVRTMVSEVDDSFDTEGPSFKHRPIIWLVDDKFLALTGTRNHSLKYKAHSFYGKDLSLMLNKVSKVYISKKSNVWKPWFEYDNLSDVRPITIFIYTHK